MRPVDILSIVARMNSSKRSTFHAAMFPWFAMGHLTSYLHLSNKLAERGHFISFLVPTRTMSQLEPLNLYPHLISFVPILVPHVDDLPLGAETTKDVPISKSHLIMDVFYASQGHVESLLRDLKPDCVFFDMASWVPSFTRSLGIKSVMHSTVGPTSIAYFLVPSRMHTPDVMSPPLGFPPSSRIKLHLHELRKMSSPSNEIEDQIKGKNNGQMLARRTMSSLKQSDVISFRAYKEIEGPYCDYIASQYGKPVLLTGPTLPPPTTQQLEEQWANWLGKFKQNSVLYCSFGSECVLKKDQFRELVLGLELTEIPFLVALKPPFGCATVEEALPEGFGERVKERGIVHGGWVQQPQILAHPSVGCFLSHSGYGSMMESLLTDNLQIVLLPHFADQFLNSRLFTDELKVAVEVERREEDGWFSKENVYDAVKSVMDERSQIGVELKANHAKLRKLLSEPALESSCLDTFTNKLLGLI